jgi:MFS family permease
MNKNTLLAIMMISVIPAFFFSIGGGITGMAIADTNTSAQPPTQMAGHFWSGAILVYLIITIVLLAIVAAYLIELYNSNQKLKRLPKKQQVKHMEKMKTHFKKLASIRFSNIDDEKSGKYIVMIVAIVALVAILIMLCR